jgi:hypothetical protein
MTYSNIITLLEPILAANNLKRATSIRLSDTGSLNFDSGYTISFVKDTVTGKDTDDVIEKELAVRIDIGLARAIENYINAQVAAITLADSIREDIKEIGYSSLSSYTINRISTEDITITVNELGSIVISINLIVYYQQ